MKKLKFAKLHKWNTSATSKGQWWNLELCDTSATSKARKAKWWNFELLAESLVWHPKYMIIASMRSRSSIVKISLCLTTLSDRIILHIFDLLNHQRQPRFSNYKQGSIFYWLVNSHHSRPATQTRPCVCSRHGKIVTWHNGKITDLWCCGHISLLIHWSGPG